MNSKEIIKLFEKEISKKEFSKRPEFNKDWVYNYKKRGRKISLGQMIVVLHTIGAIKITKVE